HRQLRKEIVVDDGERELQPMPEERVGHAGGPPAVLASLDDLWTAGQGRGHKSPAGPAEGPDGAVLRGRSLVPGHARGTLAVEDLRVRITLGDQEASQAPLEAGQGVIDQDVASRNLELELDDRRAARGDARRLHVRGSR